MKRLSGAEGVWRLEEACHLLRELPARSWSIWLAGTLPYTLALLDFVMEMSRSAFAAERLVWKSFLLALLFGVKHTSQAVYTRDCLRLLRGELISAPSFEAILRTFFVQLFWQPLRLPALAAVSIVLFPVPAVAGFFRNLGPAALDRERGFVRESWKLGTGDTRAHAVSLLLFGATWALLFLNLAALWVAVPMLLKALFGLQTDLGRLAFRLINASTFLVTLVVSWVLLEPAHNALGAVRAFYAQARSDGEDLRGALRRLAILGAALVVLCLPGLAQQQQQVDPAALDQKIEEVFREPEFAWRAPREDQGAGDGGLRRIFESIGKAFEWFIEMWKKLFGEDDKAPAQTPSTWSIDAELLKWIMIAAAALALISIGIVLFNRKRGKANAGSATAAAVAPPVDLADENVTPDQKPEDEWLRMADDCAARGEYRLAIRAVHLAGLRYLGERGYVTLQPAKTGHEYHREFERRVRGSAALEGYLSGLRQYEATWYGFTGASASEFSVLRGTWEELRRLA